jgi:hypothetical protein
VHVVHLPTEGPVDPTDVLAGNWRSIWTASLGPGDVQELERGAVEYAVYVTGGSGIVRSAPTGQRGIAEGTGIVVLRESAATLVAGPDGLELFAIAVDV